MLDLPSWVPDWSAVSCTEGMNGIHDYMDWIYQTQSRAYVDYRTDKLMGDDLVLLGDISLLHAAEIKLLSHSRVQIMCNERVLVFGEGKYRRKEHARGFWTLGIRLTTAVNDKFSISGLVKLTGVDFDDPDVRKILDKTHRKSITVV